MHTSYELAVLSDDVAREAFPLIRATWPDAELDWWKDYISLYIHPTLGMETGAFVLRDRMEGICGLFAYEVDREHKDGPVMDVRLFTAVDLANSLITVEALLDAVEERAAQLICRKIQLRTHSVQSALAMRLRALGLAPQGDFLAKPVTPTSYRH